MAQLGELLELQKACSELTTQNRQYVLAVANALKFTEENRKNRHHGKEDTQTDEEAEMKKKPP